MDLWTPEFKTGRKWSVSEDMEKMESVLKHKEIVGHTQTNRAGSGNKQSLFFSRATNKHMHLYSGWA